MKEFQLLKTMKNGGHAPFIHFSVLPFALIYRGPIICQGLCKILIEHVRGKDTVKEQVSQALILCGPSILVSNKFNFRIMLEYCIVHVTATFPVQSYLNVWLWMLYLTLFDCPCLKKFCLRVLDGYPLFYQPIYISGALVISTALTGKYIYMHSLALVVHLVIVELMCLDVGELN